MRPCPAPMRVAARKHHSRSETPVAEVARRVAASTATSSSAGECWRRQATTGRPPGVVCTPATIGGRFSDPGRSSQHRLQHQRASADAVDLPEPRSRRRGEVHEFGRSGAADAVVIAVSRSPPTGPSCASSWSRIPGPGRKACAHPPSRATRRCPQSRSRLSRSRPPRSRSPRFWGSTRGSRWHSTQFSKFGMPSFRCSARTFACECSWQP